MTTFRQCPRCQRAMDALRLAKNASSENRSDSCSDRQCPLGVPHGSARPEVLRDAQRDLDPNDTSQHVPYELRRGQLWAE